MKKIITLSLAFSALIFTANAQEQRDIKKDKKDRTEGREGMRGGGMMKDLNLTDAQKTQMKASREEFKAKMDQLKSQNLTEAQMSEQKKALFAEQKAKMESILTPEQRAKMAEQRKNFEGKEGKEGKFEGRDNDKQGNHYNKMKEKLGLSDDQAAKLKAQHEALEARNEAIKNDKSLLKKQFITSSFLFTLQHRAGVRPYTSFFNFAESCVFIKQSLPPIFYTLRPL